MIALLLAAVALCLVVVLVSELIAPMLSDHEPRRRIH
jgi:hypothetical protein